MEESQDKFSLHEMQEKKRRRYSPRGHASVRANGTDSRPGLLSGAEGVHAPIDENGYKRPQATFSQRAAEGESLQLRRIMRVMRRHWFLIAFIFVFVPALIGFIDYYLRDKVFVAQATYRQLADQELSVLQIGSLELAPSQSDPGNVEAIIEEKEVEEKLIEVIAMKVGELESALASIKEPKKKAEEKELIGQLRSMISAKKDAKPDSLVYAELRGTITARVFEKNMVLIQVRGSHPRVHEIVAEALLETLNYYYSNSKAESIKDRMKQLEEMRDKNLKVLENIRSDIARTDDKISGLDINIVNHFNQVVKLKERQLVESERLWDFESRLKLLKEEFDWGRIKKKYKIREDNDIRVVLVQGNPSRMKWRKLEFERAALLTHYTLAHPQVQRLETDIQSIKDELIINGYVNSAGELPELPTSQEEATLNVIQNLIQEVALAKMRIGRCVAEIQSAKRQEDKDLAKIKLSQEKQKELREYEYEREELMDREHSCSLKHRNLSEWIDDTNTTLNQVRNERKFNLRGKIKIELESPKIMLDVTIGIFLGLALGCPLAFLMESADNRLHTPFDVYYHLRLNYLGVVPFWGEKEAVVISPDKPDSHIAEIFAHLRNNIRYARGDSPEKCLLVASATQGEGKSTISANLASSYALEGNNVVLIDADLRRPRGHKLINIFKGERNMEYGLCDYLTGEVKFDEIIYSTSIPGLSLIPAGSRVRNPAKLMGSPEMMTLIEHAEENFDIVIVDCPAVLPVVDATTLSGHVRGVLMVIAAEEVEIGAVRMALYRLQHVGSPIVGAVLNKVRERSTSYYYYGYRYRSGYYYSPYSEPYLNSEDKDETA